MVSGIVFLTTLQCGTTSIIIRAMTAEERANPSSAFGAAERARVAASVKCSKSQVPLIVMESPPPPPPSSLFPSLMPDADDAI